MNQINKPKQARSLLKREALVSAGEAEFEARGYVGSTSKSIAERAGVATGSFYQHFANKDELLLEIAANRMELLQQNLQGMKVGSLELAQTSVRNILHTALSFIYQFHTESPELHQVLEQRRQVDEQLNKVLCEGEQVLEQRVTQFVQSFNIKAPEVVASNLFAMAEGVVHRHVFTLNNKYDPELVIELGTEMLTAYFERQRH